MENRCIEVIAVPPNTRGADLPKSHRFCIRKNAAILAGSSRVALGAHETVSQDLSALPTGTPAAYNLTCVHVCRIVPIRAVSTDLLG